MPEPRLCRCGCGELCGIGKYGVPSQWRPGHNKRKDGSRGPKPLASVLSQPCRHPAFVPADGGGECCVYCGQMRLKT